MTLTPFRRAGAVAATLALAAGALAASATSAQAAGPTGIVTGTVTQPGGTALPGASVRFLQSNDPSTTADDVFRVAEVQANGTFVQSMPIGAYQVAFLDYCEQYLEVSGVTVTVTANTETTLNGQFTTVDPALDSEFNTDVCARTEPRIAGLPQVGVPLTVNTPVFAQPGVSPSYQWRADGENIPGATGAVYVPGPQDVGSYMSVQFAGTKAGLAPLSGTVYTEDTVKRGDYVFKTGPAIIGLPIVGKSLAASPGALVPGAAVSYQWYRNGAAIAGKTARTYKVAKADQHPFQLSGGQQQRVGIARALALRPKVVLFDEPTSALDPELVGEVLAVIKDLATEGWTTVIVTHEIRFAEQVADQVLFLDGGVVVERGTSAQVIGDPHEDRTRQFLRRILDPG